MRRQLLALALGLTALSFNAPQPPAVHCQVPCGIYGDRMRIDMLMEDLRTMEKAMASIGELSSADAPDYNQLVRWVVTKEEHAQKIQDQVAGYWLAQRIKAPRDADGKETYVRQLELMHGITVAAMKCKQTTDRSNTGRIKGLLTDFAGTYFSEEDLKHLRSDHGGEHGGGAERQGRR